MSSERSSERVGEESAVALRRAVRFAIFERLPVDTPGNHSRLADTLADAALDAMQDHAAALLLTYADVPALGRPT